MAFDDTSELSLLASLSLVTAGLLPLSAIEGISKPSIVDVDADDDRKSEEDALQFMEDKKKKKKKKKYSNIKPLEEKYNNVIVDDDDVEDEDEDEVKKLHVQIDELSNANCELKKLLVASVGSDFTYRIDKLTQEKASLAVKERFLSVKAKQDNEILVRMQRSCEMWQKKLDDEVNSSYMLANSQCIAGVQMSKLVNSIENLLSERKKIQEYVLLLSWSLRRHFDDISDSDILSHSSSTEPFVVNDVLTLLEENVKFVTQLSEIAAGAVKIAAQVVSSADVEEDSISNEHGGTSSIKFAMTAGEELAQRTLSVHNHMMSKEVISQKLQQYQENHPYGARGDVYMSVNSTSREPFMNCCTKCNGPVFIV